MKWYYFESDLGCGIREAKDIEQAERVIKREVGYGNGVNEIHEATERDISWVRGMGGYIPSTPANTA